MLRRRRLLFKTTVNSTLTLDMAVAHYALNVAADATWALPIGVNTLAAHLQTAITANNVTSSADFNTKLPVFGDAHCTGYVPGAGSGITLGQACKTITCINPYANFTQTTAASQPLLLAHSGTNYLFCPRVDGNYCQSSTISINTASGCSVETKVSFTSNDDTNNTSGWICAADNGTTNRTMFFGFSSSRTLKVFWNNLALSATASTQIPAAFSGWLKVSLETSGSDMLAKFWTSSDGITYTQLGTTITSTGNANTFQTGSAPLYVSGNIASNTISGKIYRVIYSNASGVVRADFNPATYSASTSKTNWTSTTGEVWTLNQSSTYGSFKAYIVDRTYIVGDGVSKNMTQNFSSDSQPYTFYSALSFTARNNGSFAWDCGSTAVSKRSAMLENGPTQLKLYSGADGATTITADKSLSMFTCLYNGASSSMSKNNGTASVVSSTAGTNDLSGVTLMSRYQSDAGSFLNGLFSTIIISSNNDNSTIRTAMYNLVRAMNNNAF